MGKNERNEKVLFPESFSVGYDKDDFVLSFDGDEVNLSKEAKIIEDQVICNVVISKQVLKETILKLIKAGMAYQDEFQEDIGLPTK